MAGFTRKNIVKQLEQTRNNLDLDRNNWIDDCRLIASLFYPEQIKSLQDNKFQQIEKKTRLNNTAMSSEAILSLKEMAAGLQSGLVTPGRPWFKWGLTLKTLEQSSNVKEWLDEITKIGLEVLGKTNFYDNIYLLFKSAGAFGNGCTFILPDDDKHVRFKTLDVGTYYLAENHAGIVDVCIREISMTARQIVQQFDKDNISQQVMNIYNATVERDTQRFIVINAVLPNPEVSLTGLPWKFLDVYYLQSAKEDPNQFLRLSGFDDKPFGAPRWEPTDIYGTSPARAIYPDFKQLNLLEEKLMSAVQKHVDPPMIGPDDLDITPGDLNADYGDKVENIRPVYLVNPDINGTLLKTAELKQTIKRGMFINLFQSILSAPDTHRMTATEIQARKQEGLFALGTVVERLSTEALDPMLGRTFTILFEKGLFPPPPEELQGQELKVEYTSILSQAQKAGAMVSVERFLNFIQVASQTYPEIVDAFNFDAAADEIGQTIPAKLLNDRKEREEIRGVRRQQQEAALRAEAAKQGVDNIQKLADADSKDSDVVNQALG